MIPTIIVLLSCFLLSSLSPILSRASFNLTLPDPEAVVLQLQRRVNASMSRRQMAGVGKSDQAPTFSSKCLTGNPIDDCWRCDPGWPDNRQRLADCGLGFGARAYGGKGGQIYTVTDSSDENVVDPPPGTLRHAVIQTEPLWIVFSGDMTIRLRHELIMNSFKTIDGRGADVHVFGGGCITVQDVTNIIIHNLHVHDCVPSGNTEIRSTPTHVGHRGLSDGDGISIYHSRDLWIDHCSLAHCTDGLVDAIMGSTGISITNSYFAHHDEVMLLGHKDGYAPDSGMQVTLAFNVFGQGLVQRMPRCRQGYIHIVNNDFTQWRMYAIGGSANPTINSQGNRYSAPTDADAKEVTKRVDTEEKEWAAWNWRSDGDKMVNGAFFVPSGEGASNLYAKAESLEPKSPLLIDQITMNAGVFGSPRDNGGISASGGSQTTGGGGGGDGDLFGMIFGNAAPPRRPVSPALCSALVSLLIVRLFWL